MLFVPVEKRSNIHSQVFYKIDALKNLAIFTGKQKCRSFFLINFIKKRLQHRYFPMNITKCLSTEFCIEYLLFSIFFRKFFDRILWNVFGYKIDICHISCAIAFFSCITLVLESGVYCYFV